MASSGSGVPGARLPVAPRDMGAAWCVGDRVRLNSGMVVRIAELDGPTTAIVFGPCNYSAVTSLVGAILEARPSARAGEAS